jgi:hypothetical protein
MGFIWFLLYLVGEKVSPLRRIMACKLDDVKGEGV